ncbi:MAG: class I tRNA ligase family protein, partial [Treponemataceae bacterium]|nr:class I tRNA ligase family protein [Treponemataceae bacterium]
GQDILIDNESFKMGSRFCNKVWNASRYILGNLEGRTLIPVADGDLTELDRWMYAALDKAVRDVRSALGGYRYNDAASAVYECFWNCFCDWYVEATKLSFRGDDEREKDRAVSVLLNVLEESLRLLHPFIPFVTEEIYGKLPRAQIIANRRQAGTQRILPNDDYDSLLVNAPFPAASDERRDEAVTARFAAVQDVIRAVRGLRNECGIDPAVKLHIALHVVPGSDAESCREKTDLICLLAGVSDIDFVDAKPAQSIGTVGTGFEAFILIDAAVNKEQLRARFQKDIEKTTAEVARTEAKLGGKFAEHAPAELVQAEREKLDEAKRRIKTLHSYISAL